MAGSTNDLGSSFDPAEHLALALESGGLGTWRWDISSNVVLWDSTLEAMYGLLPGTFDGTFDAYVSLLHPDDVESVLAAVSEAVQNKASYKVEHRAVWPDGTVRWMQGRGKVTLDLSGEVTGTIGCVADVTDQMIAVSEREVAVAAALKAAASEHISAQRLKFLGRVNDALAASANEREVMRNVTRVAVPEMGDWCAMFVLQDPKAEIPTIEVVHTNPQMVQYAEELQLRFPYDPHAEFGVPLVIRTGRAEFLPDIDERLISQVDAPEDARDVVRSLRIRSAITVPLVKRGTPIGALQFVNTDSSRPYTEDDVALAVAVAARVASTLENRRLAEQQRVIANTLQASLLPATLPDIPGLDVAVRYWAGGEGSQVGGDFYDVFQAGDSWAAVIGDVCGTGPAAAALTGLARHSIRAAAWNGADHDDVLRQLNHAVRRSEQETFCTALFCTLTRSGEGFRLTGASGGHPLPVIVRASGVCELFGHPGSLLGILEDSRSTTCTTMLGAGDIVLMYTDGATDTPPPHDLTLEAMIEMVRVAAATRGSADEIASNLGSQIDAVLPLRRRNDDIALLVLAVQ